MARYLDSVPHPWSKETIERAILKDFTEARSAIEDTDGGKLWRELTSLGDTADIFQAGVTELLDEISLFADRSKSAHFWHAANRTSADTHVFEVKRKLFNCTAALMALVDHARAFDASAPVTGFDDHRKASFSLPGQHSFLQGLRNYSLHRRIADADWSISYGETGERRARFAISKDELLSWDRWPADAKAFIEASEGAIDIYDLFIDYRARTQTFYAWHKAAVLDQYAGVLDPYFEYKRLHDGLSRKFQWKLVAGLSKRGTPHEFLVQYLSNEQLQHVLAYARGSNEQVDALIRLLDIQEFCDKDLRAAFAARLADQG